jgi:hypothetical protein
MQRSGSCGYCFFLIIRHTVSNDTVRLTCAASSQFHIHAHDPGEKHDSLRPDSSKLRGNTIDRVLLDTAARPGAGGAHCRQGSGK